jgi:hypothetical protein
VPPILPPPPGPIVGALTTGEEAFTIDTDHDGVLDREDNCVFVANPLQVDSDEDGIGNACEESGPAFGCSQMDGVGRISTNMTLVFVLCVAFFFNRRRIRT